MKPSAHTLSPLRIAVLWDNTSLRFQRALAGLYRAANLHPQVSIRRFDGMDPRFKRKVAPQIKQWNPNGLIAWLGDITKLKLLRKQLPGAPFVTICRMPPSCADTTVTSSAAEAIRVNRDHFREQGARSIAIFCGGNAVAARNLGEVFRAEAPDGFILSQTMHVEAMKEEPTGAMMRKVTRWLTPMPKPAGIMNFEPGLASYLSRLCLRAGLRIPEDIMLIGVDDEDDCLGCVPHLTSLNIPVERIGAAAADTLMQYLLHQSPTPPPNIYIEGSTIIARGSTGPARHTTPGVTTALDIIKTNPGRATSVKELLKLSTRASRSTFYRQFQSTTGQSPARLLRQSRLTEACRLLRETSASITSIAEACGFSSSNYFTQVFNREMKMTPKAYRNQDSQA